jgi:WD40 repeat protein
VWDAATGKEVLTLRTAGRPAKPVAWSPDGKRLAVSSRRYDPTESRWLVVGAVWDAVTGKEVYTLDGERNSMIWSPGGSSLVTTGGGDVQVLDATTGKETFRVRKCGGRAVWSPDDRYLATAQGDATLKVWDATTGKEALSLGRSVGGAQADVARQLPDNLPPAIRRALTSPENVLQSARPLDNRVILAWGPDGKGLASSARLEMTIRLWDPVTGKPVLTLPGHGKPLRWLAWSPDGKRLASACDDATVKVWDVIRGKETLTLPFFGKYVANVSQTEPRVSPMVAWNRDGRRLAVGGDDGTIKVWDVNAGKEIVALQGHKGEVFAVAWSPYGKRLASASAGGTFLLWDVDTWQRVLTLTAPGAGGSRGSLAWSPDGWQLGFFSERGDVTLWDATPVEDKREQQETGPNE